MSLYNCQWVTGTVNSRARDWRSKSSALQYAKPASTRNLYTYIKFKKWGREALTHTCLYYFLTLSFYTLAKNIISLMLTAIPEVVYWQYIYI